MLSELQLVSSHSFLTAISACMGINYRLDRRKSLGNFPSAQQFHGVDNADKSLQKKLIQQKDRQNVEVNSSKL